MAEPRYSEAEWRTVDDMRRYWNAICDCDVVPIDTDGNRQPSGPERVLQTRQQRLRRGR